MDELDIMKQQMAAMKQSIERYEIINDRLMRRVMMEKSSWLNKFVTAEAVLLPLIILFIYWFCGESGMTQWLTATFGVGAVVSTLFDYKTMRLPKRVFSEYSLRELRIKVMKQKHARRIQLYVELLPSMAWMIWFFAEWIRHNPMFDGIKQDSAIMTGLYIWLAAMVIMALVIILLLFRRAQRTNDRILSDLDQLDPTD